MNLQTPATTQDERDHAAGVGGSYSHDPRTGQVTLVERTEQVTVSRKAEGVIQTVPAEAAAEGDQA